MKHVILSADGDSKVYSVPDEVAENLNKHCLYFCNKWIRCGPYAEGYRRVHGCVCYSEVDFIEYLNKWKYPDQPSVLVKNLGWIAREQDIPKEYRDCPRFNF